MIKLGLCSVTFRERSVEEVIDVAQKAGLQGIEWGADVHVPPGNLRRAMKVYDKTVAAGLEVSSYGSYYRLGHPDLGESFEDVVKTAAELKAPGIRVWAGNQGSSEADAAYREHVVADLRRIADLAQQKEMAIHLEYHGGTLTDTEKSAERLLEDTHHQNVYAYWQPAVSETVASRLNSIETIRPWLSYVHVFHWQGRERRPFIEGVNEWKKYINALLSSEGERFLLMEFVKDDDVKQFLEDAEALKHLVEVI
ncbi:MAG TPA: TIM barrel protein [Bacillota bacterium]|nr:TIM barrel protein [Bacillota bacterium]